VNEAQDKELLSLLGDIVIELNALRKLLDERLSK